MSIGKTIEGLRGNENPGQLIKDELMLYKVRANAERMPIATRLYEIYMNRTHGIVLGAYWDHGLSTVLNFFQPNYCGKWEQGGFQQFGDGLITFWCGNINCAVDSNNKTLEEIYDELLWKNGVVSETYREGSAK